MSSSVFKKDLVYSTYDEFIRMSVFDFGGLNFNNPKICNSLLKIFDEGNRLLSSGDDERAYMLLMRFFEGIMKLRGSKLYKEDKAYVDNFISIEKLHKTMAILEKLKQDIKERYNERDKLNEASKSKNEEIKTKNETDVQTTKTISDLELNNQVTKLNCKELLDFVNKSNQKILIIDTRSKIEFDNSHMNLNLVLKEKKKEDLITYVNIPDDLIEHVAWKLNESLAKHDLEVSKVFEARGSYDYVIIFDKDSTTNRMNSDSKLAIFKRSIYDFDTNGLKREPIILEGGWSKWTSFYPGFTESSKNFIPIPNSNVPDTSNSIKNVLDFDYPEISDLKKPIIPVPEIKSEIKTNIISQLADAKNVQIPADINNETKSSNLNQKPIPNVNRSNKPTKINATPTEPSSNKDPVILNISSSSSDEEENAIFNSKNLLRPEPKSFNPAPLNKPEPILNNQNQIKSTNSTPKFNIELNKEQPKLPSVPPPAFHKVSNNINDTIFNTVYAPARLEKPFQTPYMKEGGKVLNSNTGLFSYRPGNTVIGASSVPVNPTKIDPTLVKNFNVKEIKFVPPNFTDFQKPVDKSKDVPINNDDTVNRAGKPASSLKRTFSSPNIAKLDEDIMDPSNEQIFANKNSKDFVKMNTSRILVEPNQDPHPNNEKNPNINSITTNTTNNNSNTINSKSNVSNVITRPNINRNNKPMPDHVVSSRIEELQPVYGNVHPGLTGIKNFGNTCFMNSILQCLNSTEKLVNFFLSNDYKKDLNRTNDLGFRGEIADEFSVIVQAIWGGHCRIITPVRLRNIIGQFNQQFITDDQQDSQELLLFLLDGLHEDLNRIYKRPRILEKDEENEKLSDREAASLAWKIHLSINNSIIVDLFQGQFKSTVTCLVCNKKSVKFDAFMYLTLPLLSRRCSLYECLDLFLRPEEMYGESKWKCPKCKQYQNAVKKIDIWKLPPLLIIHLKRFKYHGVWRDKITTMVDYPVENLNLDNFVLNKTQNNYRLYAISNHTGNLDGGHYVAMCRHFLINKWFKFDDSSVKEINDLSTLVSPTSYILFYSQY